MHFSNVTSMNANWMKPRQLVPTHRSITVAQVVLMRSSLNQKSRRNLYSCPLPGRAANKPCSHFRAAAECSSFNSWNGRSCLKPRASKIAFTMESAWDENKIGLDSRGPCVMLFSPFIHLGAGSARQDSPTQYRDFRFRWFAGWFR